eukprot:TRINITY_DN5516_c2_g2_i1.p1 TRINITY_DN5516_c2_g2~~TRINITY_DN5516_c2_g2_i1.p1  ORF type:complete len:759 (-),score=155.72 TRINITY_DN5516_c2_g2_i1:5-2020(-)
MNTTLSRKLNKVLETRTTQPELLNSLKNLSTFYGENTLTSRRNLRGDIENHALKNHKEFLSEFEKVQEQIDRVEASVLAMQNCCKTMDHRLQRTRTAAGRIIGEAHTLQLQRETNEGKQQIAQLFLARFQLTSTELAALKGTDRSDDMSADGSAVVPSVNRAFFDALKRVHTIHNDCKMLIRTQHQRAGLEIMESMSMHEQAAYERLYRWLKSEAQTLEELESPEPNPLLRVALRALLERPVLFNYCLEEIEHSRSRAVARSFLQALTRGGAGGLPKPIEIHAHNPARYLNDMLAWIHQAVANEYDLIHGLLDSDDQSTSLRNGMVVEPAATKPNDQAGAKPKLVGTSETQAQTVKRVMERSFEGTCRPLRVRIEQIIASQENLLLLYQLANIIDFYGRTVTKHMPTTAPLVVCIADCKTLAMNRFFGLLQKFSQTMQRSPPLPPSDLSPPSVLTDHLGRLKDILTTFNTSLVPSEEREKEFAPVLSALLDPLLRVSQLSASSLDRPVDMALYLINCMSKVQGTLNEFEFTDERGESLAVQVEAHMSTLVEEEALVFLEKSKLSVIARRYQNRDPNLPLSNVDGMEPNAVADSLRNFEGALENASMVSLPNCDRLINLRLHSEARARVAIVVADMYSNIYEAIMDPSNGYADKAAVVRFTPSQVKTMLDAM